MFRFSVTCIISSFKVGLCHLDSKSTVLGAGTLKAWMSMSPVIEHCTACHNKGVAGKGGDVPNAS